jgi:catechol-2,3-dioxygenase
MRIQEVKLTTDDLAGQARFYREVLRLPVEEKADQGRVIVGRSRLIFQREAGWQGAYHIAFDVPENQLEAACAWLDGRATLLTLDGETRFHAADWNADMVYFRDAAGNVLEFIARHNQPNASPHPFDQRGLVAITEVGLGVRDVRSTVGQLMAELGVRVYDGAGSSSFSAVGDEAGLLIVVQHEREWFPATGQPGGLYPLTVRLEQPAVLIEVNKGVIAVNRVGAAQRVSGPI